MSVKRVCTVRPRTLILEHIVYIRVSVHHHLVAHVHLVHPEEVQPRVAARLAAAGLTSGVGAGVPAVSRLLTCGQTHQDRADDHHDQYTAQDGEHFVDSYSLTRNCQNFRVEAEMPCPWIFTQRWFEIPVRPLLYNTGLNRKLYDSYISHHHMRVLLLTYSLFLWPWFSKKTRTKIRVQTNNNKRFNCTLSGFE